MNPASDVSEAHDVSEADDVSGVPEGGEASDGGGGVHRLGPLTDIPTGEARAYAAGGRQIAVFRLRSGALRAVDAVCPHAGGPIADGQADHQVVVCPLHGHTFDLATGASPSGAPALTCYPTRLTDDGTVEVTVG